MSALRRNVAGQRVGAQMLLRADGTDVTTGVAVRVYKDGTWAASAGTLSHTENGAWQYLPTQAETDAVHVWFKYTETAAITVLEKYITTALDPTNAASGGLTNLDAAVSSRQASGAVTVSAINANVITAASIAANALDDKGNWNIGKTGYSLTQTFPTNFDSMSIAATGEVDANVTQYGGVAGTFTTGRPETIVGAMNSNTLTNAAIVNGAIDANKAPNLDVAVSTRLAASAAPANFGAMNISVGGVTEADVTTWQGFAIPGAVMIENDGAGAGRWTVKALEQAPSGGGSSPWTAADVEGARHRLQLDGVQTAPAVDAPTQLPVSVGNMQANVITAASIAASALDNKGNWNVGKTGYSINAMAANTITAAAVAAGALNGKGDWNIGKTGYDLNANQGTVTIGSVSGAVGSVSAAVTVGTNNDKTGYSVTSLGSAAEPGTGKPPNTADRLVKLDYMYKFAINKIAADSTQVDHYDYGGTVVHQKRALSETAGVVTKGEMVSGP